MNLQDFKMFTDDSHLYHVCACACVCVYVCIYTIYIIGQAVTPRSLVELNTIRSESINEKLEKIKMTNVLQFMETDGVWAYSIWPLKQQKHEK